MDGPRDPFDDLADLFLTPEAEFASEPSDGPGMAKHDGSIPEIAVAIAGHLPVSAGLWLAQLTDRLARDHGPTGLIRFVAGQVHVEVFRGSRAASGEEPLDLHDALAVAVKSASRWIVVPEASAAAADVLRAGRGGLLLLTGADEAAVVGAYRILKGLAEEAMVEGRALPPISVGVLGAGDLQVADALTKLNRTAEAFLGMELPLAVAMPRMEPLDSTLRFMLPAPRTIAFADVPALLGQLLRGGTRAGRVIEPSRRETTGLEQRGRVEPAGESATPTRAADDTTTPAPPTVSPPTSPPLAEPEQAAEETTTVRGDRSALHGLVAGRPGPWDAISRDGDAPMRQEAAGFPAAKLPPSPADPFVAPPSAVASDSGEAEVSAIASPWVARFPELKPLPVGCPHHPIVELGVDGDGRLHLIAPIERLLEVEAVAAWAADHATLLRLACPGVESHDPADLVIDLITDRPRAAMPLAHSRVRVHLVAKVALEGREGWIRLPINDAAAAAEATPEEP